MQNSPLSSSCPGMDQSAFQLFCANGQQHFVQTNEFNMRNEHLNGLGSFTKNHSSPYSPAEQIETVA